MGYTVEDSNAVTLEYIRAVIYGPPGGGKTFSNVSLSAHCPADFTHLPVKVKRDVEVSLDDMLWLGWDSGALDGFNEQRLKVPLLNLAQAGDDVLNACKDAHSTASKRIAEGKTKIVVVDTLSSLDDMLTVYWRNKGFEKWDLYANIKISHYRFAMAMKSLKAHVLFLCHAKAFMEAQDKAQKDKQTAAGLASIGPQITGDALNHYRKDATFIFPLLRTKEGGIDGRYFLTNPKYGFEAKSRFQLDDVVPADWRKIVPSLKTPNKDAK